MLIRAFYGSAPVDVLSVSGPYRSAVVKRAATGTVYKEPPVLPRGWSACLQKYLYRHMFNIEVTLVRVAAAQSALRSLSFLVSRIICFSCRSFSALAVHQKSPRPDRAFPPERWTPYSLSNRPAPRGWCAPGVDTGGRTLPAGCYQYRWQTNWRFNVGRGGYS